jgi:hypothetical protein
LYKKSTIYSLGDEITICYGDKISVQYDGINSPLEFAHLVEDSRCPEGSMCIWEGRVVVELKYNNNSEVITLANGNLVAATTIPYVSSKVIGSMKITLISVGFNRKRQKNKEDKYWVKVKLEKA